MGRHLISGWREIARYDRARRVAIVAAVIGCLSVTAFTTAGAGNRSVFGPLKWGDFAHFYTLGHLARARDTALLYDSRAQYEVQVALIPDSAPDGFVSVYAPTTALLFAPFTVLSYFPAGLVWALVTVAVYGWTSWLAWRPARNALPDRTFVIAAAVGFPPVWQLVMYGQTTAVPLLAFGLAWLALEDDRPLLAGMALSLLTIKPQFALVIAPIAILAGEWRTIAGAVIGIAVQALAVLAVFDRSVFGAYAAVVRTMPASSGLLEPDAYKMHSLRALTHLLPGRADWVAWGILGAAVIAATLWIWRQPLPWRIRWGVLVLASMLVDPHLTIYDVTVLALPILWIGGWLLEQPIDSNWFWRLVFWIGWTLLLPTAVITPIQLSAILIAVLFARTVRTIGQLRTENLT